MSQIWIVASGFEMLSALYRNRSSIAMPRPPSRDNSAGDDQILMKLAMPMYKIDTRTKLVQKARTKSAYYYEIASNTNLS